MVQKTPSNRIKALNFLRQHKTMILTCVSHNHQPYSIPVTYYVDGNFNFYFSTPKPSRKYNYMTKNPHVSFVVFNDYLTPTSVTVKGVVSEVEDQKMCSKHLVSLVDRLWQNSPFFPTTFRLNKHELAVMNIKAKSVEWFQDRVMESTIEKVSFSVA